MHRSTLPTPVEARTPPVKTGRVGDLRSHHAVAGDAAQAGAATLFSFPTTIARMGQLFWLASYPKSGNTWVRAFIANLLANRSEPLALAELSRYCEDEARPEHFSELAGRPSSELDFAQISALRPRVHARLAERANGLLFVKSHNMAGSYDGHPLHNPEVSAGAIYVVRNPLDVAVSMGHHFGLDIDAAIARLASDAVGTSNDSLFVGQVLGAWSTHVQGWADQAGPRLLVLRYEDLLDKPGKAFGKVARLLGLDADRQRVERAIRHASFQSLAALEQRDGFREASLHSRRFFRVGKVNQWREKLNRAQVARVVNDHRVQMQRFKYVPAGY